MASRAQLKLTGHKQLIRKLKRLGDKRKFKRVLRKATNAAAQVVVKSVRRQWKDKAYRTGFAAKSVEKKVIAKKEGDGYIAVVGMDANAQAIDPETGTVHIPSYIDHLIELGFTAPDGSTVPARAPLRKGFELAERQANKVYVDKAAAEIEKEARR